MLRARAPEDPKWNDTDTILDVIQLPHLLDKPHKLDTKDKKGNPMKREFFAKYLTMEIRRLLDSVRDKPRVSVETDFSAHILTL